MEVLIIEDEIVAAERLESMLTEIDPGIRVLNKLGSISDAVSWLKHNQAELIFLDIQLSDGLSFSIFEQCEVKTPIIFTTAYDQYAVRAFDLNSIDYLLKPIRKSDLEDALRKFDSLKTVLNIDFNHLAGLLEKRIPEYQKRFLIQYGEKIRKVEVSAIAYFYAQDKGVFIRTQDGHNYPLEFTLEKIEEMVDPVQFFRINRRFIISVDAITDMTAYSRSRIKLNVKPSAADLGDTIVSIERSADFRKWLSS